MAEVSTEAFGHPGVSMGWTSSRKDLVTTALGTNRVWATIGQGILNEVYWPSTSAPQIRELGFLIEGDGFWREVKDVGRYKVSTPEPHIPLPRAVHESDRRQLTLEFLCDSRRDVVLIDYRLRGDRARLYALLTPHLDGSSQGNSAWVDGALLASKDARSLCCLCDPGFVRTSAGFVGASDGWQDMNAHGTMTWSFESAHGGNVALMAEIPAYEGVLALAFAETTEGARTLAGSSLAEGYDSVRIRFVAGVELLGGWSRAARSAARAR